MLSFILTTWDNCISYTEGDILCQYLIYVRARAQTSTRACLYADINNMLFLVFIASIKYYHKYNWHHGMCLHEWTYVNGCKLGHVTWVYVWIN